MDKICFTLTVEISSNSDRYYLALHKVHCVENLETEENRGILLTYRILFSTPSRCSPSISSFVLAECPRVEKGNLSNSCYVKKKSNSGKNERTPKSGHVIFRLEPKERSKTLEKIFGYDARAIYGYTS